MGPTNLFDASTRQVCEVKPTRTNTPLHALVTLNDITFAEAARVLAARMVREGGKTPGERLDWLFTLATARGPSDRERMVLGRAYARLRRSIGPTRRRRGAGERGRVADGRRRPTRRSWRRARRWRGWC